MSIKFLRLITLILFMNPFILNSLFENRIFPLFIVPATVLLIIKKRYSNKVKAIMMLMGILASAITTVNLLLNSKDFAWAMNDYIYSVLFIISVVTAFLLFDPAYSLFSEKSILDSILLISCLSLFVSVTSQLGFIQIRNILSNSYYADNISISVRSGVFSEPSTAALHSTLFISILLIYAARRDETLFSSKYIFQLITSICVLLLSKSIIGVLFLGFYTLAYAMKDLIANLNWKITTCVLLLTELIVAILLINYPSFMVFLDSNDLIRFDFLRVAFQTIQNGNILGISETTNPIILKELISLNDFSYAFKYIFNYDRLNPSSSFVYIVLRWGYSGVFGLSIALIFLGYQHYNIQKCSQKNLSLIILFILPILSFYFFVQGAILIPSALIMVYAALQPIIFNNYMQP